MIRVDISRQNGAPGLEARFEAPAGVTALFGHSGAGKTSLLRAIAGLVRPDRGRIEIGGRVFFDSAAGIDLPPRARRLGVVFQDARLFPHMTVAQNLRYGGLHDEARIVAMLGLGSLLDRHPATLSGGEKSRVALGRALMSDPWALLLDEPLAALDGPRKAEILPYLERMRDETAVPMLYVSHDLAEVVRLSTHVVMLEGGRVIRTGPVAEVLADPAAASALGPRQAGALIAGRIAGYDATWDLTRFAFEGGELTIGGRIGTLGNAARVRVAAEDVILAVDPPGRTSALNVIAATVVAITEGQGPSVLVSLTAGQARILARITRRSAQALGLAPGAPVHAILKTVALARDDFDGQG